MPVVCSLDTIESKVVEYLLFSKKLFFTLLKMVSACRFGNECLVLVSKGMSLLSRDFFFGQSCRKG